MDVAAGFDREGNEPGARGNGGIDERSGAEATVDVADRQVVPDGLVARYRLVGEARGDPVQVQIGPDAGVGLTVVAIGEDGGRIEAGNEGVATLAHDVGAEQTRRPAQPAGVDVQEAVESVARLEEQLQAHGPVVVTFQMLVAGHVVGGVHPVVAVLPLGRGAKRPRLTHRQVEHALEIGRAIGAVGNRPVARELIELGPHGFDLDDAGRRIAPEQSPLRPAQNLDVLLVEYREALQCGILLDDVVVIEADRLRGEGREVGVAVAADVEAREGAAIGRLDIEARHRKGELPDILAGEVADELVLGRDRHLEGSFLTPLGRDDHFLQGSRLGGRRAAGLGTSDARSQQQCCHQGGGDRQQRTALSATQQCQ